MQIVFRTGGRTTYTIEAPEGALEAATAAPNWREASLALFDAAERAAGHWNGAGASLPSSDWEVEDRATARARVQAGLADGWLPLQG